MVPRSSYKCKLVKIQMEIIIMAVSTSNFKINEQHSKFDSNAAFNHNITLRSLTYAINIDT